jgi:hypothetical protein
VDGWKRSKNAMEKATIPTASETFHAFCVHIDSFWLKEQIAL